MTVNLFPKSFGKISEIVRDDRASWEKVFLSFDVDWACDEVFADVVDLVERADLPATWFVTHQTDLLHRLRENPKFELGIHPNFNFLLDGDPRNGRDSQEVLDRLLAIVPEARSVRSHSLVQSEKLVDLFASKELTHISNFYISPEEPELYPWALWNGVTAVPHSWQDNVSCMLNGHIQRPLALLPGIKVFNFHPIHVFLNTEQQARYEDSRPMHRNPASLIHHRYDGDGTRTYLMELLRG